MYLVAKSLNCNRLRWPCYHTTQSVFHKSITLWSCNNLLGGLFLNMVAASLPHVQRLVPMYTKSIGRIVCNSLQDCCVIFTSGKAASWCMDRTANCPLLLDCTALYQEGHCNDVFQFHKQGSKRDHKFIICYYFHNCV